MKRRLCFCIAILMGWLLLSIPQLHAQSNVVLIEYYIDNDPGIGNATPLSFLPGPDIQNTNLSINTTTLSEGVHRVYVRAANANGHWGLTNSFIFYKPYNSGGTPPPLMPPGNITRVEYFIDNDPGIGNATDLQVGSGTDIQNAIIPVDPSVLSAGVHRLYVRAVNEGGHWSLTNSIIFYKPYSTNVPPVLQPPAPVSKIEYYLDTDPGTGNATQLSLTPGTDIQDAFITIDPSTLANGIHRLYVRAADANGSWSLVNSILFYKPYTTDVPPVLQPAANLARVEYFIDTDPGYGQATSVAITPGTDIQDAVIAIDPATLTQGVHRLQVRAANANGQWSLVNSLLFYKPYDNNSVPPLPPAVPVTRIEYYFDTDPGYGKATTVELPPSAELEDLFITANISLLTTGQHKMFVRAQNANGNWSLVNSTSFNVQNQAPPFNALHFDANDRVNFGVSMVPAAGNFTVECWVKLNAVSSGAKYFIAQGPAGSSFKIGTKPGSAELSCGDYWPNTGVQLPLQKWVHIALSKSPAGATLYLNGQPVAFSNGYNFGAGGAFMSFGEYGTTAPDVADFAMDELRIWNVARSAAEINTYYNNTVTVPQQGLVAYYNFDQGVQGASNTGVTSLPDLVNSNATYTGTLASFALQPGNTSNWIESYAMVLPVVKNATNIGRNGFSANWTASLIGTAEKYLLDVATDSVFTVFVQGFNGRNVETAVRTFVIGSLTENTTYYYRLRAEKNAVTGQGAYSATIKVTTLPAPNPPTIISFTPTSGESGTTITIKGTHFTGITGVKFGGIAAAAFTVQNDTTITAVVGAGGTGDITIKGPGGTVALAGFIHPPGNALHFNGVHDHVVIPYHEFLKTGAQITIETWVRPDDIHTNSAAEIYHKGTHPDQHVLRFKSFGTLLSFGLQIGGNYTELDVPISAADYEGRWTHIAATFDGNTKRIYRNGVLIGTETIVGDLGTAGTSIATIGSLLGEADFFKGSIDEFRLWGNALTPAQIKDRMRHHISNISQTLLLLYFNFDQGTAGANNTGITTVSNLTPVAVSGTLNSFALNGAVSNFVESYAMVVPASNSPVNVTGNSFGATWLAPLVGVYDHYVVDVATDSLFTNTLPNYTQLNLGTQTSLSVTNLTQDTRYFYRVRANKATVNNQGAYSETISIKTSVTNPATITAVTPSSLCEGDTVTVTGSNFANISSITIGNTSASYYKVVSTSSIKAVFNNDVRGKLSVATLFGTAVSTETVNINKSVTPLFAAIPPIDFGATPPALPGTSQNGITGVWIPATINNTQTGTYVFTPDAGQCASPASLTVVVKNNPDLTVQQVTASATELAPNDAVVVSWNVANVGQLPLLQKWTEKIYMQSPSGQNRTLLTQSVFAAAGLINTGQNISRSDTVIIPAQSTIGDEGVFVVEMIPDTSIHEAPGTAANNTGVQQTSWSFKKILTISLSAVQITEGSNEVITATVNRTGSLANPLQVAINFSKPERFAFTSPVTIPAGQAGATLTIQAVNNDLVEGLIKDTIHVSATGFQSALTAVTVLDSDKPTLTITGLPSQAMEGDVVNFQVTTNLAPASPLTVYLTANNNARFPVPAMVTIPAGSVTTTVSVTLAQDAVPEIELPVTINAGAANHNAANATIQLKDDDVPGLKLVIQTDVVTEDAGFYATQATLKRLDNTSSVAFTSNLSASMPNTLILPPTISLSAGEKEKTFTVGVLENNQVDGQRKVAITASVYVSSCGCSAPSGTLGSVADTLIVSDNDGPALQLIIDPLTLAEGSTNAGTLRINRNTAVTNPLIVNLQSSDTSEVVLPSTVTIPAGAAFVAVPVTTINDNTTDGSQQVNLQASATGFSPGALWVIVSDLNKPDLQIPAASVANASVNAGAVFNYQVSVKNTGFATAPAGVLVRGYLSADNIIDAGDTLITEDIIQTAIATGQTTQFINAASAPELPGQYKLLFQVNPNAELSELLMTNNTSRPVNVTINPDYTATANVSLAYYTKGTTIPVTGIATKNNGTPAANVDVEVYVITTGLRRKVTATTNATGGYTAQFIPLTNEAGHYIVGASFPGLGATLEQDAFDILGVRINSDQIPQFKVNLNDTLKGQLTVQNLSYTSLNNFSLEPVVLPAGASMKFDTIGVLAGNAVSNISFIITGSTLSKGNNFEVSGLEAKASVGVVQKVNAYYYCQAPNAFVVADIEKINAKVSQSSGERLIEIRLINKGKGATGGVNVKIPQVSWMNSVTATTLPSMNTGDTTVVILRFLALPEVPFGYPVTGTIVIAAQNGNSFSLPYTFEKVSETKGAASVIVTDQFTYFTERAPNVSGAHVQIKNYFSGVVYADGYTDANGVFSAIELPEGKHRIIVEKEKHTPYNNTIDINPGETVRSTVFINYQAITFNWKVEPTAIQDQYDITLTAQFETHVPMPVVTIEVPKTMPQLSGNEVYAFNAILTNHGLITAKDVALNLPEDDPEYEFVANYVTADLQAQQSIQVPVIMRRRGAQSVGARKFSSVVGISQFLGIQLPSIVSGTNWAGDCSVYIKLRYWYNCNLTTGVWQAYATEIKLPFRTCLGSREILIGGGGFPYNGNGVYFDTPCFFCGGGGGSLGSGLVLPELPAFSLERKSCADCIKEIIKTVVKCVVTFGGKGKIISAIMPRKKKGGGLSCIKSLIKTIVTCARTDVEDVNTALNYTIPNISNARVSVASAPSGAVFQQIADNLQLAVDGFDISERWANEYFGDMIASDAWEVLEQKLEPFIIAKDSIREGDQQVILSFMAGYEIQESAIKVFFARWNTSVYALKLGIMSPNAQFPEIINWNLSQSYSDSLSDMISKAKDLGFASLDDMYEESYSSLNKILDDQKDAVCASVTVQFSQQLTMTREAFEGILEIFNGHPTDAMDSLTVNIQITDQDGVPSNGLFEIQTKSLSNLSDVTGTGAINAQQKGNVKFLFIPEPGAAPQTPKIYNFGGSVLYWDPYAKAMVTLPLTAVPLTVNPSPNLMLHYFMERNILGDDALTSPAIEPSVPAELAVMIENQGYGPAVNLTISAAQPKIVENEKGLAINFSLIGSNFQGKPRNMGVTNINFGTIPPLETRIGQWYFTSSLLGKFVSYEANVVHANSFGNPELSLVKGIKLHELTKSIRLYGDYEDGINDFLVNDIFDVDDKPDIIYFSQGNTTEKVYEATAGSFTPGVSAPTFTNTLRVTASRAGWNYIKLNDPGNGLYELVSVTRNDGQVIPLNNAWLTFVTLPVSRPPVYEHKFHFVDNFATTEVASYTVVWKPKNFNVPKIDSISGAPKYVTAEQVKKLTVIFNKAIDPASFTYEDLTLTFQGGPNIINSSVAITQVDSATFTVDLSRITTGNGFYAFTAQAAEVSDVYGIKGLTGKQSTWTQFLTVPTVQAYLAIPENHFATAFDTIQVLFNLPVSDTTATLERFTVHKNGITVPGTIVIDSVRADKKLYYLSGLKNILTESGTYHLVVDLPMIRTLDGVTGMQPDSVALTVDNAGPTIISMERSNQDGIDSQHVTFVNIMFQEDVKGFNTASVKLTRNGETIFLNIAQLSNTDLQHWMAGNFGLITYPEGSYTFTVDMTGFTDMAGNKGTGVQQISWVVNRSSLITLSNLVLTPDLGYSNTDRISSGDSLQVVFHLDAAAAQVTIAQTDISGETVLKTLTNVIAGDIATPVTLLAGGNTGIKVMATGANGGTAMIQQNLFIDQAPLTGQWLFTNMQTLTKQVDTIPVVFSSKLLNNTGILNALTFNCNGTNMPVAGLQVDAINDTTYHIRGLRQATNFTGNYQLTLNLQPLNKYRSGKAGTGNITTSWILTAVNQAPVARAINNVVVTAAGMVTLDGSDSYDPDSNAISYRWIAPAGVVLNDSTLAKPGFLVTSEHQGKTLSFLLIVSDGALFNTTVVNVVVNLSGVIVTFSGLDNNYCANALPVQLTGTPAGGTFSGAGISGNSFNPSVAGAGTHQITYTLDGQSFSKSTVVKAETTPLFDTLAPICAGATAPVLPTTSLNGIPGTWSPGTVSNTATNIYIFTPADGQCATKTTLLVKIDQGITYYRDLDGDGYGSDSTITTCTETPPAGYVAIDGDCNDNNATVHPGATELCNGKDDNCNAQIDEGCNLTTWYRDNDGDGYGNSDSTLSTGTRPAGYVAQGGDCNDHNVYMHPGASDPCNGIDDNCNGLIDEEACERRLFYRDADGDGYGVDNKFKVAITQPVGYSPVGGDCNDNNPTIHPNAPELPNGIDDNCNGIKDEGLAKYTYFKDEDGDGYGNEDKWKESTGPAPVGYILQGGDCNDKNANIHPGVAELPNGKDDNCDGQIDEGLPVYTYFRDADGDGYGNEDKWKESTGPASAGYVLQGGDCNDNNATIHPGAIEIPGNKKDDNCNGEKDEALITVNTRSELKETKPLVSTAFNVIVSPIPSMSTFNVYLKGSNLVERVTVRVFDQVGKLVELHTSCMIGQQLRIGEHFAKGLYIVEAIQGNARRIVKIIKL